MRLRWWWRMRGWHGHSGFDKVDLYTRGTLYGLVWIAVLIQVLLSLTRPVRGAAPAALIVLAVLLALVQGVGGTRLIAGGLDEYLGRGAVERRLVAVGAVSLVANVAAMLALARYTGLREFPELGSVLGTCVVPFSCAFVLIVPGWVSALQQAALSTGVCVAVGLLGGGSALMSAAVISTVIGTGLMSVTTRMSAWTLGVMWKLREARDVEARLAVAEERLRFGRDMHDVLGLNLAVIALKSELAVELAQRGKPAAADQMVEVMRIARASQQEVRDVVRGYREADLSTELVGARSVLRAAGIDCEVAADGGGKLPAPVQAALGWVVREAATNVLRHGDPRHCTIRLRTSADAVVLDVENDGAPPAVAGPRESGLGGSGLAGLRERLRTLDGSLDAGPAGNGLFRLTATIPLSHPATAPASGSASAPVSASGSGPGPGSDLAFGPVSASASASGSVFPVAPPPQDPPALQEERR
ncbi:sensor histidine kinase [Streptomyces sp. NPDC087228]|uniref:sensor histidine kinase n=1 Tax=Streptomyces sp. NPDC087228 TaxID=3365772 RepID=UPI00382E3876